MPRDATTNDDSHSPGKPHAQHSLGPQHVRASPTKRTAFRRGDQFAPEIKYFSECILENREPEPSAEEGWCDIRVVEAIIESARSKRPVELAPYTRGRRPSPSQVDHEPPIKKPKTVHAPSPSVK